MKRIILLSILIIVIVCAQNICAQYYYSDNRQIPLLIDSTKITILFDAPYSQDFIEDFMDYYARIDSQMTGEYAYDNYEVFAISDGNNLDEFIDTLLMDQGVSKVNPYYLVGAETPSLVGKTICCKFNDTMSYSAIDSINQVYGVEIVREKTVQPKEFLLTVNDDSPYNTLELANIYYEMDCVEYSHPNFYGCYRLDSYQMYDHYWPEQWAMHRIFGISPESTSHKAFEITTGSPDIIVAAIDCGIGEHEDINSSNFYGGYDFLRDDNDPSPCSISGRGGHGISVAGIIFGKHNRDPLLQSDRNTGIYGIAPGCKIMPIKITSGSRLASPDPACSPY